MEQCMEYALSRGIHRFLFLGDYIGELAYPERTMALLRFYEENQECVFIRGNKEEYWIKHRAKGDEGWQEFDITTGALWYAYCHLTGEDIDFFEKLPIVRKVQYEGFPALTACHGSPESAKESMWLDGGRGRTEEILKNSGTDWILCGHTHIQGKLVYQGKILLNPGSVGLSWKGGGKSQFMLLHGRAGGWQEEFISLDYDKEEAIRQMTESGLAERTPHWCLMTERLLRGTQPEVNHAEVLKRVMELCYRETGKRSWPDLPKKYWDMAIKEFFDY